MNTSKALLLSIRVSLGYFVVAVCLAVLAHPGYQCLSQFLSALGVGNGGAWFNSAVILLGATTSVLYLALFRELKPCSSCLFLRFAAILAFLSSLMLFGVGLFIADGKTSKIHDFFAVFFFLLLLLASLLFAIGLLSSSSLFSSSLLFSSSFHQLGLSFLSLSIFLTTTVGLFLPDLVNVYLFQKLVVTLYLVFISWLTELFFHLGFPVLNVKNEHRE